MSTTEEYLGTQRNLLVLPFVHLGLLAVVSNTGEILDLLLVLLWLDIVVMVLHLRASER